MCIQRNENFGLINRTYDSDSEGDVNLTQWQRFERYVTHINKTAPEGVLYKVIYVGRHGEGFRESYLLVPARGDVGVVCKAPSRQRANARLDNLGEAKYGTKAWDDYWSKLDGDGELYWFDAHLTDTGKSQARSNNVFFKGQFEDARMPAPEKYYVSPLYRCLQTAELTYSDLDVPSDRPFKPLVKELMREVMGEHTCDKRSSRTVIHDAVPEWEIEAGFTEKDELWQADHRETDAEHDVRTQKLLDDVFAHDGHSFISFTSHSGSIASLLRVVCHRQLRLPTGGLMPMLLKATNQTSRS